MSRQLFDSIAKFQVHVSDRDQRIYEEVVVKKRSQREVAAEFKISQSRVSKIVRRVFAWMSETAPCGLEEVPRPQRLYGVSRTYKMKLDYYEQRAMQAFDRSEREKVLTTTYDLVLGEDGKYTKQNPKVKEGHAKPDLKFLNAAQGYAQKQVEFEGIAKNGAVARNNDDRLHEEPHVLPGKELDAYIDVGRRAAQMKAARAQKESAARGERAQEEVKSLSGCSDNNHPVGAFSTDAAKVGLVRENAEPNDFEHREYSAPGVASATATPSPRYSGERAGVRGDAGTDLGISNDSSDAARVDDAVCVPAPAPHPIPLPGVPRRGDRREEVTQDEVEAYNDRYLAALDIAMRRAKVLGREFDFNKFKYSEPGQERFNPALRASAVGGAGSVPAPAPHPSPLPVDLRGVPRVPRRGDQMAEPPKRVFPPAPKGFVRTQDGYAVRGPYMTRKVPDNGPKKPFMRVSPPKRYKFNEKTQEWDPCWNE